MFLALILLFSATICFYWFYWRLRHLPPGPIPWPIVGNIREIIYGHEHEDFVGAWLHWKELYGPIFTVHFSTEPIVAITDYQLINELIIKDAETFRGRWFFEPLLKQMKASGGLNGIFRNPRDSWQIVRRFTLHKLRNLGMGRPRMEEKCIEFLNRLVAKILEENRCSYEAGEIVNLFHGSTINFLIFGKNVFEEMELKRYKEFRSNMSKFFELFALVLPNILLNLPALRFVWPFGKIYRTIEGMFYELNSFYAPYIAEKLEQRQKIKLEQQTDDTSMEVPEEEDFLDSFLNATEQKLASDEIRMETLNSLLFDIHATGMNNGSNILEFLILYLALDNESQMKLQSELDALAQTKPKREGCIFGMSDRTALPYTMAVCEETLRKAKFPIVNTPRRTTRQTNIGPYRLEPNTTVIYQPPAVACDETLFPNENKFIPERFISADQKKFVHMKEAIPFGVGKRSCIGEALTRMELFLFAANFFYKFEVYPENPMLQPTSKKVPSITAHPEPFSIRLVPRQQIMA